MVRCVDDSVAQGARQGQCFAVLNSGLQAQEHSLQDFLS